MFAAQYAEAIKLRREVDPVLGLYETLKASYAVNDYPTFNSTVAKLRKIGTERAGEDASTLGFEKTYNGFEPFYRSSIAYVLIFMIAGISWLAATYSSTLGKKGETARMLHETLLTSSQQSSCFPTLSDWQEECISKVVHL